MTFTFINWLPKYPVFWFTLTQSVSLPMVTYPSLCSTCVTYRTLCLAIGHQVLPTQPLRKEAEDFPRGYRHFKHVPPLIYLIYLSPKELYVLDLFKRYGYLAMKHNVSYEIWTLFTIYLHAICSMVYPFAHRVLWSMAD